MQTTAGDDYVFQTLVELRCTQLDLWRQHHFIFARVYNASPAFDGQRYDHLYYVVLES